MESVGQALNRWRRLRGFSLRALGAGIKYSHVYLWEIEKRHKRALPEIIRACDDFLDAGGNLIALAQREDDVNRRDFVRTGLSLAVAPVLSPLDAMSGLNDQLWRVYAASPNKSAVLPLVHAQLTLANDNRLRANLLQLAGEIYFDANRYGDAANCYAQAAIASEEAKAPELWACALTRHAFVCVYERRFTDALLMLDTAERVASKGDSQLTTAQWVQVVKAQVFAGLGRLADCQRSLELAQCLDGKTHNGGWLRFDGPRIPEESGSCYVELGNADLAEPALHTALSLPLSARRRGTVLADLAVVGFLRKDREQVNHYATAALDIAKQTGSGVVMSRLANLQSLILEAL